jgi:CheY-like chemotaxis protein
MFEKAQMEVEIAINGHQAFEILNKQTDSSRFDLVILDLNMPISDGYETCRNIIKVFTRENIFKPSKSDNSSHSSVIDLLPAKHYQPVIVALSSLVTKDIEKKT